MVSKQEIRREIREKAAGLPASYYARAGAEIRRLVEESEAYRKARTVMMYVSRGAEPDTRELAENALRAGKTVLLPRCEDRFRMTALPWNGRDPLIPGRFGIPEPAGEAETAPEPELILVPCVAATAGGKRLGHGKGYYDRFLREHPAPTMCLCFRAFLLPDLPEEETDIRMRQVITEP